MNDLAESEIGFNRYCGFVFSALISNYGQDFWITKDQLMNNYDKMD